MNSETPISQAERTGNMADHLMNAQPRINIYRLLRYHRGWCQKLRLTLMKKGSDYAGHFDVLSTFKRIAAACRIPVAKVMQLQAEVKSSRIAELIDKDPDKINYEGLSDTLSDRANYDFLHMMYRDATVDDPLKRWIPETKPVVAILANCPAPYFVFEEDNDDPYLMTKKDAEDNLDALLAYNAQFLLAEKGVIGLMMHTMFPGVDPDKRLSILGQTLLTADAVLLVGLEADRQPHMVLEMVARNAGMLVSDCLDDLINILTGPDSGV